MVIKNKGSYISPFDAIKFLFKKPVTVKIPYEIKQPAERYRGFHINDHEKCVGCGSCSTICPDNAIDMVEMPEYGPEKPGYRPLRPQVDYGRCCFCGLCVEICPTGSLQMVRTFTHVNVDKHVFVFLPDKSSYVERDDFVLDYKRMKKIQSDRGENL